jgi:probable rRNA maturation factor
MPNTVLITVEEPFAPSVSEARLEKLAKHVLESEGETSAELSILVTDDETVHDLNKRYAGEDHTTDVLSFSLLEGEEFVVPDDVTRLGEVIISYPTAERQAADARKPVGDEIDHLLVHGILHLLGYDHANPEDERTMFARTADLLA